MGPDTYASVLTLCNVTGKTKSNMAAELIEASLKNPKYRALLQEAADEIVVSPKEDPRTESRRRTTHRQPSARAKEERPLPTVWSEQAAKERWEATKDLEAEFIEEEGGLYNASHYIGMTTEERKAWDEASRAHIRQTQAMPPSRTKAQQMKLQALRAAGEITREEYLAVGASQVLKEGEDKLVKEVDMRGDLLKTIGEQDERLKKMEEMMSQMAAMMAAKA